jgi:hypothetical protein
VLGASSWFAAAGRLRFVTRFARIWSAEYMYMIMIYDLCVCVLCVCVCVCVCVIY